MVIETPVSRWAAGHRAQHPLHARRDSRGVGGTLEDSGPDPSVSDPLTNLPHEQFGHRFGAPEDGSRTAEVEEHGDFVVGEAPVAMTISIVAPARPRP